ncbi:MAG TPA: S8 family serine peptidase [Gemmatimonadales bacterium]
MRLYAFPTILIAALSTGCADPSAPNPGAPVAVRSATSAEGAGVTGRHLIRFHGVPARGFAERVAALGGRVEWLRAGLATVSGLDAAGATALAGRKDIAAILDDVAIPLDEPLGRVAAERSAADLPMTPAAPQAAFFFARQWHLRVVGADRAWAAGNLGRPSVTAYILDTGIDGTHPDLAGLVDLTKSVDLLGTFTVTAGGVATSFTESDTVARYFPGAHPSTDLFYHGTHVAATISSNAVAAAGVTSRTTLVAVKVCAYLNTCPLSSVLRGVLHAADNGADVINLSLGGGFAKAANGALVGLVNTAFNHAASKGSTIVVAAGNASTDLDHNGNAYASYCDAPGVICASATGPAAAAGVNGPWTDADARAAYSNYGRSAIDLAAPGGTSAAPVWAACSRTSVLVPVCQAGAFVIGLGGTSMAAPHVAGAVALLVPELGRNPAAIHDRLRSAATDLGQPGTDPYYGKGRLNVARALGIEN